MEFYKLILILLLLIAAVLAFYFLMTRLMRRTIRSLQLLGDRLIDRLFRGLAHLGENDEERPRSLPNMESLILPRILKDYPGFDLAMAKNAVKDQLTKIYGGRPEFMIHNVVLTEYRTNRVKKAVIFQAALCYRSQKLVQKKVEVTMEFQCVEGHVNPAINCPNCGATLGFGDLECKYCGTRINDRRDQEWAFPSIREIW